MRHSNNFERFRDAEKSEGVLDVRNMQCPWPVLKARKRLMSLPVGSVLRVEATDPMSRIDIPHFCAEAGHELLDVKSEDGIYTFVIRKAG
ncbi:sulfurtransferase TusA family protein [Rhodoligotrophos ferricapiens]|uniref:sulfurtransferase TusA family protein n=1 Tax=Rhodoligotrophos ferricapiens TaxID=3069264 RepID=UPI00315D3041